ncbi:MAG: type III pantothenate kinase [Fibrobacterota bacterium]
MSLLIIDHGNSRVKIYHALTASSLPHLCAALSPEEAVAQICTICADTAPPVTDLIISAVAGGSAFTARLQEKLPALPRQICTVNTNLLSCAYNADHLGIDRYLAALAASRIFAGRSVVIADAGTALTVDILSPAPRFEGGWILAGIRTKAAALHSATDQLPAAGDPVDHQSEPPTTTKQAIAIGARLESAAALEHILTACGGKAPVLCTTGGDWPEIAPYCKARAERYFIPDLIARGALIWFGARRQ